MDPQSLNVHEITAKKYFDLENQIQIVPFHDYKSEFIVLDCEEDTYKRTHNTSMQTLSHKSVFVDIARTSDFEKFQIRSHLGDILKAGDIFVGFDLKQITQMSDDLSDK